MATHGRSVNARPQLRRSRRGLASSAACNPNDPGRGHLPKRRAVRVLGAWPSSWSRLVRLADQLRNDELEAERRRKSKLREDYKKKLAQAINLDALRKQQQQVKQYVDAAREAAAEQGRDGRAAV